MEEGQPGSAGAAQDLASQLKRVLQQEVGLFMVVINTFSLYNTQ